MRMDAKIEPQLAEMMVALRMMTLMETPNSNRRRKRYEQGTFIFHLAGRNREKSASYYTPEVLTRCVVKYTLKEALPGLSADQILDLRICEPAMGSAAFINEMLNQLADAYLERKQDERGDYLPPDDYRDERQKVKAYLAAHNVYGVDLNPTAVELARVSIWLNTLYKEARAPWYGPRLAVGNSLIGARRQVYSASDVLSGDYAKKAPDAVPLGQPRPSDDNGPSIYHFLLPDKGMAAFDKDKVIKELGPRPSRPDQSLAQRIHQKNHQSRTRQPPSPLHPHRRPLGPTHPRPPIPPRTHPRPHQRLGCIISIIYLISIISISDGHSRQGTRVHRTPPPHLPLPPSQTRHGLLV